LMVGRPVGVREFPALWSCLRSKSFVYFETIVRVKSVSPVVTENKVRRARK